MARTQAQSDRVDAIMAKVSGGEPKPRDYSKQEDRGALMRTFNWYSYEKDRKDALAYVRAYLKKNDPKKVATWDKIETNQFVTTYGWIARMVMQGSTFDEKTLQRLNDHINELMRGTSTTIVEEVVIETATPRKSIQEAMLEKQAEFIGEIEGELDNFIENNFQSSFDLYKYCQGNNVAKQYMAPLTEVMQKKIDELNEIGTDDQITEAYKHLGKRQVKKLVDWLTEIQTQAGTYANFKKANRKPRAKKQKPAGEQVAKMKYLKKFEELNLESVSPASIIGAQQIWVYNVKNKKLGVYHATGATGFSVKGTSLQGYDPEQSVQRTLRKPAEVIPAMLKAGKIALRRILSDLSTTETPLNGRFNDDVMILRVL